MKMKNTINIQDITKYYNGRTVVDQVSLTLTQGESVGLFGSNGAGKTTCFSIIIGLVKPDSGTISYNKENITSAPIYLRAKLGIGYLPQETSIFRGLSAQDNIRAILEIIYDDKEIIEHKIDELLEEFSITHLRNKLSTTLSGGERRRLEIARALASNPKFLMLDEPLAGIDPLAINDIKNLILHLKERNIGILVTDHNVRDTLNIVDRAYVMYDGKILMDGTPKDIIKNHQVKELYLGHGFAMETKLM